MPDTTPSTRTFYAKTFTIRVVADRPIDLDESLVDLIERDSIYGSVSGPPLAVLEGAGSTTTISSAELATLLLDYEAADEDDCERLRAFGLTGSGADVDVDVS